MTKVNKIEDDLLKKNAKLEKQLNNGGMFGENLGEPGHMSHNIKPIFPNFV